LRQPIEGKRALHVGRKWQPKRRSRGRDPRLLRLTLERLPDHACGERPRASKAVPYPKARLADCNLFVLAGALICIKQPEAEGAGGSYERAFDCVSKREESPGDLGRCAFGS